MSEVPQERRIRNLDEEPLTPKEEALQRQMGRSAGGAYYIGRRQTEEAKRQNWLAKMSKNDEWEYWYDEDKDYMVG